MLLGDQGYPLEPWLLVPFHDNPNEGSPQGRYNKTFIRARNTIERLNGVLKGRFRCLSKQRILNYNPIKAAKIIYSCGVLHNMAQYYNNDLPGDGEIQDHDIQDVDVNQQVDMNLLQIAQTIRDNIVQVYFT